MKTFYTFLLIALFSCETSMNSHDQIPSVPLNFDWQGHRGCRGLMPENSIEGFIAALEYPITTLELDVVLSRDGVVVVSHEPCFSEEICLCDSLQVNNLYQMTYDEIKQVDCGSKQHPRFPKQQKRNTYKPSLIDVVNEVKMFCDKNKRPLPGFNIELKSKPEWDREFLPDTRYFVERVYQTIRTLGIEENTTIQSFDPRVLNIFRGMKTQLTFAFLTEDGMDPLEQMQVLTVLPHIYSPHYKSLSKGAVKELQMMNIRVIPWTVNDLESMRQLLAMGVDGIITDYPNLIQDLK